MGRTMGGFARAMGARGRVAGMVAVAVLLAGVPLVAADTVTVMSARIPGSPAHTASAWDGTHAYITGGYTSWGEASDQIIRYDPATDVAETMAERLLTKRYYHAAVSDGRYVYVFGGNTRSVTLDDVLRYDPAADHVQLLGARLPAPLLGHAAVWAGDVAYIFGGIVPNVGDQDKVLRFDPARDVVEDTGHRLPVTMRVLTAAWDGRYAYLFNEDRDDVVRYDPTTGDARFLGAKFPSVRAGMAAVWDPNPRTDVRCDEGCVYLLGGQQGTGQQRMRTDHVWAYSPKYDELRLLATLNRPVDYASAVWAGDAAYLFAGYGTYQCCSSTFLDQIAKYAYNEPPVPRIAPVPQQECTAGGAEVRLDGSASSDADGDPITFAWSAPGIAFDDAASATPKAPFPLGTTKVTLEVSDGKAKRSASADVVVADTLPPSVAITRPEEGGVYAMDQRIGNPGGTPTLVVGPITVAAAAQDRCGLVSVVFAVSSGATATRTSPPWEFLLDAPPSPEASASVTATARDLGAHAAADAITFTHIGTNACTMLFSPTVCGLMPAAPELPDAGEACRMALSEAVCGLLP